jgi:SMC interacting uncharacterized protein involved in chromosome segregation
MTDAKTRIDELLDDLKQMRDELKVKVHLAKLETSDEWDRLEKQLAKLEVKAKEIGAVTLEESKDVGAAAKVLGEEIRDGLKRIAKHF